MNNSFMAMYELGLSDGLLTGNKDKEMKSLFGTPLSLDGDAYDYYNRGFYFGKFMFRRLNELDEKGDLL